MKKFVSIILALTMVLALGSFAMAEGIETEKTTTVTLNLGSETCTWSVPPTLTLEGLNASVTGTVSIDTWKVESGKKWTILCNNTSIAFPEDVTATVELDPVVADLSATSASGFVRVSLKPGANEHLAGSYSSSISFTLSYSGDA